MWYPQGIYSQYILSSPSILIGDESVRGLYNYPSAKIALIHGSSFWDKELFESVFKKKSLRFIKRSWSDEPDLKGVASTISELEEYRPDTIIAVGGGSVIDGAKLSRLLYEFPYYQSGTTRLDGELFKSKFIAVPTTVGSGAEVSSAAVYVDTENHRKDMVVIHQLQPEVIVYDRRYVEDTPIGILCASVLDAMAHIIEGYVSRIENPVVEFMAEQGLSIIVNEMGRLISSSLQDVDFTKLQYAGYLGGIVQNHCIVGAAHGIAHQLTEYGFSHGEVITLLLPIVIEINATNPDVRNKYEKIFRMSGLNGMNEIICLIHTISKMTGIDRRRDELKMILESLVGNVEFCENVRKDRGCKGNPIDITDNYILDLVERL